MKRKRSKEKSIEDILAAAREEFFEHGFSGARVDAIAARAGVNKALLYFHIGGKAALYERVLHSTFGETVAALKQTVNMSDDPVEKLRLYVQCLLKMIRANPQMPSIILRELADGARHLPDTIARHFAGMFELLTSIVQKGVETGVLRPTAPILLHFMVVGPALFHPRISALQDRFDSLFTSRLVQKNFNIDLEAEIEKLVVQAVKSPALPRPEGSTLSK
jgi:TetR/AcrR family transcriptional regulator